jgi:hypothetical protein
MLLAGVLLVGAGGACASPKPDLWARWEAHSAESTIEVDHSAWDRFLKTYLVTDHPSGVNRVRYSSVTPGDQRALKGYVERLQDVRVSDLRPDEQKAYWINLYNALTARIILDHYPVKSIRDIRIDAGLFRRGPWNGKLLMIEGEMVTLNDIEHRILRPIFKDARVHYAVNCASMGCPNLQPEAFTARNTDRLLDQGAREYINHSRGIEIEGKRLTASSIFKWFRVDFGESEADLVQHWLQYAEPSLAEALKGFDGKFKYEYNWSLNE